MLNYHLLCETTVVLNYSGRSMRQKSLKVTGVGGILYHEVPVFYPKGYSETMNDF